MANLDSVIGPVKIIHPNEEDRSFELNEDQLSNILLDPKYADKKVALVSVAGAFRKGKSFMLNFFLRYLTWKESGQEDTDWLTIADKLEGFRWRGGSERETEGIWIWSKPFIIKDKNGQEDTDWLTIADKLEGFSWRGGSERETEGILMWSKPFIIKDKNGEDVVVFLMDTQGAFDSLSTVKDCATVFAISTMLSSVQIYNISQNIQEDDLLHLDLFTSYSKKPITHYDGKPFQSLLFLVRDWSYPYDADYGFLGGQRILDKRLEQNEKQHQELRQLRQHIRDSFENIQCFLMPHPGLEVARKQQFKGELEDIDATFLSNLRVLVTGLFDSNITPKVMDGADVTCRTMFSFMKKYVKAINEMGEPKFTKDIYFGDVTISAEGTIEIQKDGTNECRKILLPNNASCWISFLCQKENLVMSCHVDSSEDVQVYFYCKINNVVHNIVGTCSKSGANSLRKDLGKANILKNEHNVVEWNVTLKLNLGPPDFTICCEEYTLHVHKSQLVLKSAVFAAMLKHKTIESKYNTVNIIDLKPHHVQQGIQDSVYLYQKTFPDDLESLFGVWRFGNKYDVADFNLIEDQIMVLIGYNNVIKIANFSMNQNISSIYHSCIKFCSQNFEQMTCFPDFLIAEGEFVKEVQLQKFPIPKSFKSS
uniref:GB1/RHD3-type G domain-containing protein n=2 Tax=Panagrolaimus sp. JU765 TaxID=591449 RepID=A0AC34RLN1_9BILA